METAEMVYQNLGEELKKKLHREGFKDSFNVMHDYIFTCGESPQPIHWVCNAAPGLGKTTALKALVKFMDSEKVKTPLLIVTNNKDNMRYIYEDIKAYAETQHSPYLIQYLNEDNFDTDYDEIDQYQVLIITQQRLRDLKLGYGDEEKVLVESRDGIKSQKRLIIVDEMPIFIDDADFDISSQDNHIDWFDHIGRQSGLDSSEMQWARSEITNLFRLELCSESKTTRSLIRHIENTPAETRLNEILSKLSDELLEREYSVRYRWFLKLLRKDNVGVLDKRWNGNKILCVKHIDYRDLGNVLILDGTSDLTPSFYQGYDYKRVNNYHEYSKRLYIHHRSISTTKDNRIKEETIEIISNDIVLSRLNYNIEIFPLMLKNETKTYIENGLITEDQIRYFEDKRKEFVNDDEEERDMAIHLLNTVGKNVLNKYNSLALLSLPIRNPMVYKKSSIALLGNQIDTALKEGKSNSWFVDAEVQRIYEELFIAELVQIIHRCSLRNSHEATPVHILLYTSQYKWIDKLKGIFKLPDENVDFCNLVISNIEDFEEECEKWANKSREYLIPLTLNSENPFGIEVYASKIGGTPFKQWITGCWNHHEKKKKLEEIFEKYELSIKVTNKTGYKKICFYGSVGKAS